MDKSNRGVSLIESLVCIVIIGIGFIGMMQLSAFTINSMDRATEKNKLNFLSEMVMEDMIGDTDNASKYSLLLFKFKWVKSLYKKNE
jgi:prepilin-type N-terminal cleavage/methylation domain-containing protein